MKQERERIKKIINKILEDEFNMCRLKPQSRQDHIINQIFFKIDNPDYKRTTTTKPKP